MRIAGLPVSPGVAWGPAALLLQRHPAMRYSIPPAHVGRELGRLEQARATSAAQLRAIHAQVVQRAGADLANLFEAQLLMLEDDPARPAGRAHRRSRAGERGVGSIDPGPQESPDTPKATRSAP